MANERKLKRIVIKEELVEIAGDFVKAAILNQFIYWSERVSDFDEFILQENKRAQITGDQQQELTHGWIYKTAEELSDETMLGLTSASIRTHIKVLIEKGFISERTNPRVKWDRTKQYRVNILEIMQALAENGCVLDGYRSIQTVQESDSPFLKNKNGTKEIKIQNRKNYEAIPETITEITIENKKERKTTAKDGDTYDDVINSATDNEELRDLYKEYIRMRKLNKSPMTNRALQLLINKNVKLSDGNEEMQKSMLETAIMNNWKSVYPPKEQSGGYGAHIEVINGERYEVKNGKYYVPGGSGVAVDPFAKDDLPF